MTPPRTVTRQELYDLVWSTPMRTLAKQFGISDRGLAKICEKLDVPTPPVGYWAKKAAGKKVQQPALAEAKPTTARSTSISPSPKPRANASATMTEIQSVKKALGQVALPDFPNGLHRLVKEWVANHKAEQARQRKERDRWATAWRRIDLTDRDVYRFQSTSAVLTALESHSIQIAEAGVWGDIRLLTNGEPLKIAIKERLQQSRPLDYGYDKKWSAYGDRYPSSLYSTGRLRVNISTAYAGRWERRWEETDEQTIVDLIPIIVAEIVRAGPILTSERLERERQKAEWAAESARKAEFERDKRTDDQRWEKFRSLAADWHEACRLRLFIDQIADKHDNTFTHDGRTVQEWIEWAKARINKLDPTNRRVWHEIVATKDQYHW